MIHPFFPNHVVGVHSGWKSAMVLPSVPVVPDDFHSAQRPNNAAREPHLAIGTGGDGAKQFVIGNQVRRLMVHG